MVFVVQASTQLTAPPRPSHVHEGLQTSHAVAPQGRKPPPLPPRSADTCNFAPVKGLEVEYHMIRVYVLLNHSVFNDFYKYHILRLPVCRLLMTGTVCDIVGKKKKKNSIIRRHFATLLYVPQRLPCVQVALVTSIPGPFRLLLALMTLPTSPPDCFVVRPAFGKIHLGKYFFFFFAHKC